MNSANRVVINTGILYARMAVTVFISLYSTRLILSALGVVDFGLFNVIGGAISMLGFFNGSMAAASQRFMSYAQGTGDVHKLKNIFNVSFVLHLLIACFLLIILEGAGLFFFDGILNIPADRLSSAKLIYQFMIVSTLFTIISVPYDAVINAHENMMLVAIVGLIEAVCKLGIAIYITQTDMEKLVVYGFAMAFLPVFLLMIQRIYCHQKYVECDIQIYKYFDKSLFKEMTSFAGWNFLGSASSMIAGYGSGILLNHFFGAMLNTVNAIAGQVNGQLLTLTNTMQKALNPLITKSEGSGNRERMVRATLTGSKISFLIFAFLSLPFLIETPYLLKLWLKTIPEWTVIFCRLGIIFCLIQQVTITLGTAISAVGNIKMINIFNSIVITVNLLVLFLLFKLGAKPTSMPVIAIFVAVLLDTMKLYYAKKYCGIKYETFFKEVFFRVAIVFGLSLLIAITPLYIMEPSFSRLIIVGLLSTTTYVTLSYFYAFSIHEKKIINNLKISIFSTIKHRLNYGIPKS